MSDLANKQAFPVPAGNIGDNGYMEGMGEPGNFYQPGLTFREYAAVHIMANIIGPPSEGYIPSDDTAKLAVELSDALISALEN